MIAITGATGQLGQLVIHSLLKTMPADTLVAAVRKPAKASGLLKLGLNVREADYDRPATLREAFRGVEKLLLISGNRLEHRKEQHRAVIEAAKATGVRLIAYTSILHADASNLLLAADHKVTESDIQASGMPYVFLRNGWYFENLTAGVLPAVEQGAMIGGSGAGRFSAAERADFALAAAAVLTGPEHDNRIYELAGDSAFTREELAAEVGKQTKKSITYRDLPQDEYAQALAAVLPRELGLVIADAEAKTATGVLEDESGTLSRLTGRPTTTLAAAVENALRATPDSASH